MLIGIAFFLAFIVLVAWLAYRGRRRPPPPEPDEFDQMLEDLRRRRCHPER